MRYLLVFFLLLISSNSFASEKSISVTIKPSASIVGTISFNIHPDQSVTVLVYESASKITESPVSIDSKTVAKVSQLSERVLDQFVSLKDYSQFPEYKQGSAIAITQSKVTKSISTRRYSEQLISLIKMIKDYVPKGYKPQLEKK
jgi:hypothetical protein